MITIERDYKSTGTKYTVKASDPGFGKWKETGLTFEEALVVIAHYHAEPHDQKKCRSCQEVSK